MCGECHMQKYAEDAFDYAIPEELLEDYIFDEELHSIIENIQLEISGDANEYFTS